MSGKTRLTIGLGMLLGLLLASDCATSVCSEAERGVLAQFPQYGHSQVTPEGNIDTRACTVTYAVPDSPEQVRRYFVEQLTAHGWTVEPDPPVGTLVEARQGDFSYFIYYEDRQSYPTPQLGTHLAVHVREE